MGAPTTTRGEEMHALIRRLYPICRSLTGDGVRTTLDILEERLPLTRCEVPTGTPAFDWTVPKEWNITDAYVKDRSGRRVIDFQESNLHVVSYSTPVHATMTLEELRPHLHSLPDHPSWIPHRTTYFNETWGFSLRHEDLERLEPGDYEVKIDSTLEDGTLTYAELFVPGDSDEEVLLSCHICHPSLCNDNLSGIALATFLAEHLLGSPRRRSYRLLFIPGTIGSIVWLAHHRDQVKHVTGGLVLSTAGDRGHLHYKRSRSGDAEIDRAVLHVLRHSADDFSVRDFEPYGYDERQYSSPGFGLPIGSLTRTPYGQFAEYHTSADDLDFVSPTHLEDTLSKHIEVLDILEGNGRFLNTNPYCEPRLGHRGLYSLLGGRKGDNAAELAVLWVLNLSDGSTTLLEIADRSGIRFRHVLQAAQALVEVDLLTEVNDPPTG